MDESAPQMVQAVHISCSILATLKELQQAGVTELANKMGYSKSTVHNHLTTLENHHLVVNRNGEYCLSLRFLDIATHVRDQFGSYDIIKTELENLADETGEVAQFGIEEHGKISYLYKAVGDKGVKTASIVGTQQPIHSTALGKAILSQLPEQRIQIIVDQRGLSPITKNTITDIDDLNDELASIREQGHAVDDEENVLGLRCIAAPVSGSNDILAAVSVSAPSSRFSGENLHDTIPSAVMSTANVIELNTKFD